MLNFLVATYDKKGKKILFATKFSLNLDAPSLFYFKHENEYAIISSERLNNKKWINIKKNSLIKISEKDIQIEKI